MKLNCFLSLHAIFVLLQSVAGQNLISDPGFEVTNYCTEKSSGIATFGKYIEKGTLVNWNSWGGAYFNKCHEYAIENKGTKIETKQLLYRSAHSGNGYISMDFSYSTALEKGQVTLHSYGKPFTYCRLVQPLVAGKKYSVEVWVRLDSSSTVSQNQISFDFTDTVANPNTTSFISKYVLANSDSTGKALFLNKTNEWTKIKAEYIAKGGERYFILGGIPAGGMATTPANKNRYLIYQKKKINTANQYGDPNTRKTEYDRAVKIYSSDKRASYHFDDVLIYSIE